MNKGHLISNLLADVNIGLSGTENPARVYKFLETTGQIPVNPKPISVSFWLANGKLFSRNSPVWKTLSVSNIQQSSQSLGGEGKETDARLVGSR